MLKLLYWAHLFIKRRKIMKALIVITVFSFSGTFCQETNRPSQIQQILQFAGISDESSDLPCDPFLGAITATTLACYSCGAPIPLGCALSTCTATCCIIYSAPVFQLDALRDYVHHSNFCGARVCRTVLDTVFKHSWQAPLNSPSLFSKYKFDYLSIRALAAMKNGLFTVFPCMAPFESVTKKTN